MKSSQSRQTNDLRMYKLVNWDLSVLQVMQFFHVVMLNMMLSCFVFFA